MKSTAKYNKYLIAFLLVLILFILFFLYFSKNSNFLNTKNKEKDANSVTTTSFLQKFGSFMSITPLFSEKEKLVEFQEIYAVVNGYGEENSMKFANVSIVGKDMKLHNVRLYLGGKLNFIDLFSLGIPKYDIQKEFNSKLEATNVVNLISPDPLLTFEVNNPINYMLTLVLPKSNTYKFDDNSEICISYRYLCEYIKIYNEKSIQIDSTGFINLDRNYIIPYAIFNDK